MSTNYRYQYANLPELSPSRSLYRYVSGLRIVNCLVISLTSIDNAVMIGWASMHRFLAQDYDDYSLDLRPKWNIDELST